jgi:cephalosporin hydroxylase
MTTELRPTLLDVENVVKNGLAFAEMVVRQVYSDEEKERFSRTIKAFNELYYYMNKQTWSITTWRGVHVLKPPTDMWVYQELIHEIKPDLIIETGTMFGGSALFMRDVLDKVNESGRVISIDITHDNLDEVAKVPGITFYKGSSVDNETVAYVKSYIHTYNCKKVMVILDSDHETPHVLKELDIYAPMVTVGSILIIEDGNNHEGVKRAIEEWYPTQMNTFRKNLMCEKFMLTFNRDGYYEREK